MSKIGRMGRLLIGGAAGLLVVAGLGGAALAAAEGTSYVDGLSLAFSTASTTGFGPGPQTTLGLAVTMMVFAAGAACWFVLLVAAFETGLRRRTGALGGNGMRRLGEDAWPRVLGRREGGRE